LSRDEEDILRGRLIFCSYNVTPEELFDLFGKFGPIRYVTTQIELQMGGILI
jgi:RNA recognition motif-containing protein